MNTLRQTIKSALRGIHIETGKIEEFKMVVNKLEVMISKKVLSREIDTYSEEGKDFTKYNFFED